MTDNDKEMALVGFYVEDDNEPQENNKRDNRSQVLMKRSQIKPGVWGVKFKVIQEIFIEEGGYSDI